MGRIVGVVVLGVGAAFFAALGAVVVGVVVVLGVLMVFLRALSMMIVVQVEILRRGDVFSAGSYMRQGAIFNYTVGWTSCDLVSYRGVYRCGR